jgi:hypothetical protein
MRKTFVKWINRAGQPRQHTLFNATLSYARNWWRENIAECQGILSIDEARASKLELVQITFDSGPQFDLTITRMDNPNSQLDPQSDLRDLIHLNPEDLMAPLPPNDNSNVFYEDMKHLHDY